MKKIGDITSTADKHGEFTDGNISVGTPPTQLMSGWFNSIQREILKVLENAGIEQDPNKDNQLALSIINIIESNTPEVVNELGDSETKVISQKAVSDAISESQINVPDATTEVKGKVKLTNEIGENTDLVPNQKAVASLGFGTVGSFEDGLLYIDELTHQFQMIYHQEGDIYYRWGGEFPKKVPKGSTPSETGGINDNAWTVVWDGSLRPIVNNKQGIYSISLLENGGIADKVTDNTQLIQHIINSSDNIFLMIEKDCKWNSSLVDLKDNVNIFDYSGWDNKYQNWTAQVKLFLDTDSPQTKNANEYIILSRHHPALILDNYGDENDPEGEEHRASVIFRSQGVSKARVGIGATGTDTNFVITNAILSAIFSFKNTNPEDFELALNSQPVNGVDYFYGSRAAQDQIHRKAARDSYGVSEQYYSGSNNQLVRINYNIDGSIQYSQLGTVTLNIASNGAITGDKKRILKESSYNLSASESGIVCTNISNSTSSTYTLPVGVGGIYYELVNTTGTNLSIKTRPGESFTDGSISKTVNSNGSSITCLCISTGNWVVY
ncbi:hypothetical protein SG222_14900 [Providencia rettgeri]|nr:hypothetical protein [Providencia rettgeri]